MIYNARSVTASSYQYQALGYLFPHLKMWCLQRNESLVRPRPVCGAETNRYLLLFITHFPFFLGMISIQPRRNIRCDLSLCVCTAVSGCHQWCWWHSTKDFMRLWGSTDLQCVPLIQHWCVINCETFFCFFPPVCSNWMTKIRYSCVFL